jgi:molybdate transport system permease protein
MDLTPLWLTLKVAGVATLVTFIVGVNLAFLLARSRFWGREGLDALCTLPLVLPPTVLGYYLIVLIGRHGWLGHWLQETWGISLIFTWQGAALAAAVVSLPLIFKSARAAVGGCDFFSGVPAPGLAGNSGRGHAGLRQGHGRVWRHPHGGRQPPR